MRTLLPSARFKSLVSNISTFRKAKSDLLCWSLWFEIYLLQSVIFGPAAMTGSLECIRKEKYTHEGVHIQSGKLSSPDLKGYENRRHSEGSW